ncbi:LuxR C-terminal-related transcriptional regulator [Nonomuraea sp. NPDC049709]|uniref:LuxR C-terminal-related transcriptional regulator n=1 Tax=Nonomuraea sp. NPDC049709 TaxID=3154736 RepID=UPI003440501A
MSISRDGTGVSVEVEDDGAGGAGVRAGGGLEGPRRRLATFDGTAESPAPRAVRPGRGWRCHAHRRSRRPVPPARRDDPPPAGVRARGGGDGEHEVLALMAEGLSNQAVGRRLFPSESAIAKHTTSMFGELGITDDDHTNRRVLAVLTYLNGP